MKNFGFRKLMIFIILSATVALVYQTPYLRYTFYDQMMAALQLNDTQMAFLASAMGFTTTLSYPFGGIFANRISMRNLVLITLGSFVCISLVHAFTTNYALLIAVYIASGFFSIATIWSAYLTGIRNLGDESIQGKLFGFSEATRGVVQTIMGFVFIGIFGACAIPSMGMKWAMIVSAIAYGLLFVLAFIFIPKGSAPNVKKDDVIIQEDEKKYSYLDVIKNKGVWIVILLIFSAFMSWSVGNSYMTTYTVRVVGISESLASTIGIIRTYIVVTLAGFLGGWLLDKFTYKGKGFIALFCIVAALVMCVMLTNKIVPVCVALTLLFAFFVNVMKATYWSVMEQAGIPAKMMPLATAFISIIVFLPEPVVPMFAGPWLDAAAAAGNIALGFNKIFILLFVFSIIGVIASFLLMK